MKTVLTLLGTRPEIIKLSPLIPLLEARSRHILVHSGQHYSIEMDQIFFDELDLPAPEYTLSVGSASHGEQTARMLSRLEPILLNERPDAVLVQGDTNTTLAGALCGAKLGIPVVHLEAGGRSFNRRMPEELNRIMVDHIADLLLAADTIAERNLLNEGLPRDQIHVIGSSAIDAVLNHRPRAVRSTILERLELQPGAYLALTLHRAENTGPDVLPGVLRALGELSSEIPIVFMVHPRTSAAMQQQGLTMPASIRAISPLGYLDTLHLVGNARALLTDSGGLQEEAGAMQIPTLILRNETEWRYLVDAGLHVLVGNSYESIRAGSRRWLEPAALAQLRSAQAPILSGAAERAVNLLLETAK
jgi:UDP-N-acetylglucosamine 2-epimerase (non-hydrolysing)